MADLYRKVAVVGIRGTMVAVYRICRLEWYTLTTIISTVTTNNGK